MKKAIIGIVAIILALIIYSSSGTSEPKTSKDTITTTHTVQKVTIEEIVEAKGTIFPRLSTAVRSEINGPVVSLTVEEGNHVKKGQVLAVLDTTSLEAEFTEVSRAFEAQKLRVERAKRDFERFKILSQRNYAQEKEYLDAETNFKLAELELEIRKARVDSVQDELSKATIKAPHGGVVLNIPVNEGEVIVGANSVSNGTTLMRVASLEELLIEIDFNEIQITKIRVGDTTKIEFDALPQEHFTGTVSKVSLNAVSKNGAQVFPVEITLQAQNPHIRPGMTATVSLSVQKLENVLGTILTSVFIKNNKRFVYRSTEDGDFEQVSVETGIRDTQYIQIKSGLNEGDIVSLVRPE